MPSKEGPALFELIRQDAPGRTTEPGSAAPAPTEPASPSAKPEAPAGQKPASVPKAPASPSASRAPAVRLPLVELTGEHIRISFTSITAAVTVGVAALVLMGAHEFGRRSGYVEGQQSYQARTQQAIDAAAAPLAPELLAGVGEAASAEESPLQDAHGRPWTPVPGTTYIVVQDFKEGHLEDALDAQAFLRGHDVNTVLAQLQSGALRLLTTRGHDFGDDAERAQSKQLMERIRALGDDYRKTGGRYGLQGYAMTYARSDG